MHNKIQKPFLNVETLDKYNLTINFNVVQNFILNSEAVTFT